MTKTGTAAALVLVLTVAAIPRTAAAFKEHWHKAITFAALSFLDERVLSEMLAAHDELDAPVHLGTAGVDRWHFNDCDFEGATRNIRQVYAAATGAGTRPRPEIDWLAFGRLLHTAQDFYAHSNWVDLGQSSLVDSGLGEWMIISPYQSVGSGVVAVAGPQPGGGALARAKGDRAVVVTRPDGTRALGLVSGAAFIQKKCPAEIQVGHWDEPDEQGGLAKDYPCRGDSFWPACSLAFRQTLNEWCRLLSLVEKAYGPSGRAAVLSKVKPPARDEAEVVCRTRAYLQPSFGGCSCGG